MQRSFVYDVDGGHFRTVAALRLREPLDSIHKVNPKSIVGVDEIFCHTQHVAKYRVSKDMKVSSLDCMNVNISCIFVAEAKIFPEVDAQSSWSRSKHPEKLERVLDTSWQTGPF